MSRLSFFFHIKGIPDVACLRKASADSSGMTVCVDGILSFQRTLPTSNLRLVRNLHHLLVIQPLHLLRNDLKNFIFQGLDDHGPYNEDEGAK
jgi:hypothetical protein